MSDNITNTAETGDTTPTTGEKTFTQDDVNRIIGDRLAKEKAKAEAELAQKEQEIQKRELLLTAKEMLTEHELPAALIEALNMSSPEALARSIQIIKDEFTIYGNRPGKFKGITPADGTRAPYQGNDTVRAAMGLD